LLGQLDEALEDGLWRVSGIASGASRSYLDGADIGVLRRVFVLVQAVLGELALAQVDAQLDEEDHDGLERGDGAVAGALRGDMFVEQREGSLLLLDADELLGAFSSQHQWWPDCYCLRRGIQCVLRLGVRRRRHAGQMRTVIQLLESRGA
jgi:hypothetical protein